MIDIPTIKNNLYLGQKVKSKTAYCGNWVGIIWSIHCYLQGDDFVAYYLVRFEGATSSLFDEAHLETDITKEAVIIN